ncbi:YraN family protein [Pokkaliibacter plantistimulans]|uniref:YraN family protein n=1 Tax=Pokkaliibacter plantistimulans TaxID=1635171 RepID=UPI002D79A64F|nr:YraN family protein [Pokkaliibacter plantistimulans]
MTERLTPSSPTNHRTEGVRAFWRGRSAEQAACDYLKQAGLTLVDRNIRLANGEIDIIVQEQNILIFVEVRYRSASSLVSATQSVDTNKQSRIINAAHAYLQRNPRWQNQLCRFDVIAVENSADGYLFNWLKNAFTT